VQPLDGGPGGPSELIAPIAALILLHDLEL